MLAIPFTVLVVFTFNILLVEFGAADYSGVGAAEGSVYLPSLQGDARIRTVTQTYEITRTAVGFVVSNPGVSASKSFTIRVAC
jgi:hypothetical protein